MGRWVGGLVFFFFFVSNCFAGEIVWLKLAGDYQYADATQLCENKYQKSQVFISIQLDDAGLVEQVRLKTRASAGGHLYLLSDEETKQIKLFEDEFGRYWILEWKPSTPIVSWLLNQFPNYMCKPKAQLVTADPALAFYFDDSVLGVETLVGVSNDSTFKGKTKDGRDYKAKLSIVQRQVL